MFDLVLEKGSENGPYDTVTDNNASHLSQPGAWILKTVLSIPYDFEHIFCSCCNRLNSYKPVINDFIYSSRLKEPGFFGVLLSREMLSMLFFRITGDIAALTVKA